MELEKLVDHIFDLGENYEKERAFQNVVAKGKKMIEDSGLVVTESDDPEDVALFFSFKNFSFIIWYRDKDYAEFVVESIQDSNISSFLLERLNEYGSPEYMETFLQRIHSNYFEKIRDMAADVTNTIEKWAVDKESTGIIKYFVEDYF